MAHTWCKYQNKLKNDLLINSVEEEAIKAITMHKKIPVNHTQYFIEFI